MPFRDDRRRPTAAQGIATAVCAGILGALLVAGLRQQPVTLVALPELKLPLRQPPVIPEKPRRPEPVIRVNLTASPQTQLRLAVRGPYLVRSVDSPRDLSSGESLSETTVTVTTHGLKFGSKSLSETSIEIVPTNAQPISVNDSSYHGTVRVERQKTGKLTAINVLPLEQYVSCVLDAEMPAKFPSAAREAQAIVARTYALWQMQQANPQSAFDVFATVRSQKYLGVEYTDRNGRRLAGESASSRQAVAATRGQVCRVNGRLFCTYYSAVCGGATTPGLDLFPDADAALRSVPCTWCRESDKYRWTAELTPAQLLAALRKQPDAKQLTSVKTIRQTQGPQPGVISEWSISDGRHTATVTGVALRQNLPPGKLLSPHCALRVSNGKIIAEGHGHGHGAGLCQWGARGLANAGKTATEIVQYYYPGSTVTGGY